MSSAARWAFWLIVTIPFLAVGLIVGIFSLVCEAAGLALRYVSRYWSRWLERAAKWYGAHIP